MSKPKRFYKDVTTGPYEGREAVLLDGRQAKTVGRHVLAAPPALAAALRAEWDAQEEQIDLASMPLTRIHGFVLDAGEAGRHEFAEVITSYAKSDLLCYRAPEAELARRQADLFGPFLARAGEDGLVFNVTEGIVPIEQGEETLEALGERLAAMETEELYPRKLMTEILGSAILALYAEEDAEAAFAAARLDETYQAEAWGTDAEAQAREDALRRDFDSVSRYLSLVSS
jgi:chaperone required for assembly of F1-ATPase